MTRTTPFINKHREHGAKLVEFAGFLMPLQYKGILHEHRKVRESAGVFDVSHMGEIIVSGPGAKEFVDSIVTNDLSALSSGEAVYSPMCNQNGGIIDDILVYGLGDSFMLVVNASNTGKDFSWIKGLEKGGATVRNVSDSTAQLALQGPLSEKIARGVFGDTVGKIEYYKHASFSFGGGELLISRTGYTGEDGFEIYLAPELGEDVWNALFEAGRSDGLEPVGLGARDVLRLEMGYCLYGNDIDETTSPLEAGLGWTVRLEKERFQGREALLRQKASGLERRLAAFEMEDARIPRKGNELLWNGRHVGTVTSGTFSPSLGKGIGMGYVTAGAAAAGEELRVQVRETETSPARVVKKPFYKRPSR